MANNIITVGFEVPGNSNNYVRLPSKKSLLDADIVIFRPNFSEFSTTYEKADSGLPQVTKEDSRKLIESITHWKEEIINAIKHGKTVFYILQKYEKCSVYTGQTTHSGTGRSLKTINYVSEVDNYSYLPIKLTLHHSEGSIIKKGKDFNLISEFWNFFKDNLSYSMYLENSKVKQLLITKTGNKVVSAIYPLEEGHLILLPKIDYDSEEFTDENEDGEAYWNAEGVDFGKKFMNSIINIHKQIKESGDRTPAPKWANENQFLLKVEETIKNKLKNHKESIKKLQNEIDELDKQLVKDTVIKGLLYETGKPLEKAIIEALKILRFKVETFDDGDSEFDSVFTSQEGRFLGEAEGKDNKAINIDKHSQLERNLSEDFNKNDIEEYAKGVLFGNAERLKPIKQRGDFFTKKCLTASKRINTALVRTPDLFVVTKKILETKDEDFAKKCRLVILNTKGDIVNFPSE